tara:strand:- start:235 stop:1650 length:1416 start_codon:yes stop_codon:yes gene_type:complete
MNFVFYDFETSGKDPCWDQILQVGAILVDESFNEIETLEMRCKLKRGLIPSAGALKVNHSTFSNLIKANKSHYEMICELEKKFKEWSPAVFIGYNNLEFDEEFLRNSFFKTLRDPYLTSMNRNKRSDLLGLLRTLDLFFPDTIKIPKNEKQRKVFKLDKISPFNGIDHFAHDALGDVKATIEIAKMVAKRSPEIWKSCLASSEKSKVLDLLNKNDLVFFSETYFGKTTGFGGCYILNHPIYKYPILFDLSFNPEELIDLSSKDLKETFLSGQKFIRTVRHNKNPILLTADKLERSNYFGKTDLKEYEKKSNYLKNSESFKENILLFLADLAQEKEQKQETEGSQVDIMAEESLYSGGFPSFDDLHVRQDFGKANWSERYDLCKKFSDKRLSYFGIRLIYEEFPEALPKSIRDEIHRAIVLQVLSENKERWNTLNIFNKEIENIENEYKSSIDYEFVKELRSIYSYIQKLYQ